MAALQCAAFVLVSVIWVKASPRAAVQTFPTVEQLKFSNTLGWKSTGNKKAKKVSFSFTRSGGFAGAATSIHAIVTLEPNGGSVSAPDKVGYHRALTAQESAQLRAWLQATERTLAPKKPQGSPVPDSFQYSIITQIGQRPRTVDLSSPENAALKQWVEDECRKIWDHLIESRKSNS
jgi:hypothetical protein